MTVVRSSVKLERMNLLTNIIIFSLLGGVVSLFGGILLLYWKKLTNYVLELTSFAAGVLIAISVLDLLPESFEAENLELVSLLILAGVLFLFFMERTSIWFHHHHEPHGHGPAMFGVWFGDTLHNFIDGLAIGASFLLGQGMGIATAFAVGIHELPQEIADFSLYIKAGYSKAKTITLNILSSLSTLLGALLVYAVGDVINGGALYIIGFTAGMFLYIALADLVPELHMTTSKSGTRRQLIAFVVGLVVAYASIKLLGV